MIILYTSISIVVLAFILCLIIKLNNNRKENIQNTVKQAFWNDCNKHSLLLFHLMVDKLNVQESDLPEKNYELTDEAMFQAIHEYQHVLKKYGCAYDPQFTAQVTSANAEQLNTLARFLLSNLFEFYLITVKSGKVVIKKEIINIIKDCEKEFMERAEKFEELKKRLGITQ